MTTETKLIDSPELDAANEECRRCAEAYGDAMRKWTELDHRVRAMPRWSEERSAAEAEFPAVQRNVERTRYERDEAFRARDARCGAARAVGSSLSEGAAAPARTARARRSRHGRSLTTRPSPPCCSRPSSSRSPTKRLRGSSVVRPDADGSIPVGRCSAGSGGSPRLRSSPTHRRSTGDDDCEQDRRQTVMARRQQ